ncbi:amino acid ABC transporter permease [Mycolicibacterium helvum]|uniref:ABC transporter permease n=1 Tax=Mycolicibacterium helvum TaxID=1534349 RepID=A0A7I7T0M2_9MYCO|nr:amino acid ABC transporter permease [Mycolicibacterium helvum]BBY62588.1 ABC transporter permease [Mycolicibacterium helvum]
MTTHTWLIVAQGIVTTLQLTVVGFALGAVLGLPLLVLRISRIWVLRAAARVFIEITRGVPLIIWLFLIYNGPTQFNPALGSVFTSWRSAVIAIGVVSAAYMAEIYRGALRAVDQGQFEASRALGMSQIDTASRIVGPQMIRVAIPASASYAIGLLKDSSLASTIGVFEITYYATTASSNTSSVTPFFVAGIYYVALTFPSAWAARRVEARMLERVA